jgi:PAS domain S-box-containing protein
MGSIAGRGELLEAALRAVADGVIVVGPDGSLLFANPAFARMWGIPEGVLGTTSYAFQLDWFIGKVMDPDEFLELIHEPAIDAPEFGGTVRFTDGRVLEVLSAPLGLPEMPARVLSFRDVSARITAEQELRTESIRMATLLEHIPAAVYEDIIDPSASAGVRPVYMGDQVERITGYTAAELIADAELWERILHPEDQARVIEENRAYYEEPNSQGQVFRLVTRDSRIVWIHDWGRVVTDPVTGERHVYGVLMDITRLHEVEEYAEEMDARWRAMLEEIPGVVYRYDAQGHPGDSRLGTSPWISPAVEEFFGHTRDEWISNPDIWIDMLHPDDREWVVRESERTDATGEPFDAEYRFVARDGTVRWVHDRAVPIGWDGTEVPRWWLGLMMDVTERRALQQRIVEAQEEERAKIARAIEDTSMQAMAAAGLRASVVLARGGLMDDPASAGVQIAIEEAMSSLRKLLFELRPASLDRSGLSDAAGEYLRLLADSTGSELRLDDRLEEQPPEPTRTAAYRVVQALGQATLGAGLGTAVMLSAEGNGIRIVAATVIAPVEQAEALALARERAHSVGGRMDISPDGVTVEVWLPALANA